MSTETLAIFTASGSAHPTCEQGMDHGPAEDRHSSDVGVPLCVDLDGTLVKSDTLVDSVFALARQDPLALLSIPAWLLRGRAAFKMHIGRAVKLDVTTLPYNRPLLKFLFEQYAAGRPIYLATAADRELAERVTEHLGIFTGVLASDGACNLAGENKYNAFRERFGDGFAYVGNAAPDLPALTRCAEPMVANPTGSLREGLRAAGVEPIRSFLDSAPPLKGWLRALRVHQWAKNALIFLPLLLAHPWAVAGPAGSSIGLFAGAAMAFFSFCLCASATYIVNDLLDLEADRRHLKKQLRPFASGDLSAQSGLMAAAVMLAASLGLAFALPRLTALLGAPLEFPIRLLGWLAIYAIATTAYSLKLKRLPLVDVIVLSGLYTIRILAGSAATGVPISTWMGGFSVLFFLSLAYAKRFAELENLRLRGAPVADGRGYLTSDIEQLRSLGTSSAMASVVVLTMYISNLDTRLYHHPGRLWLLLPTFLLWISNLWLLASRGELSEDPVVFAITDKRSLLIGLIVLGVVLAAL
jgi:4-hydroxybenzoate polyprenyltransferase